MKERPIIFSTDMVRAILDGRKTQTRRVLRDTKWYYAKDITHRYQLPLLRDCPYGQPGDRLWVRETFAAGVAVGGYKNLGVDGEPLDEETIDLIYKADGHENVVWQSSRFMFKKYARIWQEITDIGVERLQEITEEDARDEGVKPFLIDAFHATYLQPFQITWDSLNTKQEYKWESNPWIWVIKFRTIPIQQA